MNVARAVPARSALDHLLLGTRDLDEGIAWMERRTGVRAAVGGSHPGRGTRNALLSLGGRQYLEIIAPDPAQSTFDFQIDLRSLAKPRLVTWAAVTDDLDNLVAQAKAAGRPTIGPRDGSRARPDGKLLEWRTLGVAADLASRTVQPIPFFIEWGAGSIHPAEDSPSGCRLQSFRIRHPTPAAVRDVLAAFGIEAAVTSAKEPLLSATVETPKGVVDLA
jgi:hypothetical protein